MYLPPGKGCTDRGVSHLEQLQEKHQHQLGELGDSVLLTPKNLSSPAGNPPDRGKVIKRDFITNRFVP